MDHYYKSEHLTNFGNIGQGNPELAEKFFSYYTSVFADGALSVREKALIALAVAHTVQCPTVSMPTRRNRFSRVPTSNR